MLRRQYPGWEFHVVDAEVALSAGFIAGVGDVDPATGTKKRPDYLLIGRRRTGRDTGFKVIVLECKGTHQNPKFAIEQLARATAQVESLTVAGRTPLSLMVASHLTAAQITSYLLDPDGDGDLWTGPVRDMDDLLRGDPQDENWTPDPMPGAATTRDEGEPSGTDRDAAVVSPPATEPTETQEQPPPAGPYRFNIPEDRRTWFVQILTRAAAATTLLFARNSAAARDYATPRQRREAPATNQLELFDLDREWATSTATTLSLPNGLRLEGTRYRTPLPDGTVLEVFRGVERRLYSLLANGQIGPYMRAAPGTYRKWSRAPTPSGAVLSLGRDGTALVIRLTTGRDHRD